MHLWDKTKAKAQHFWGNVAHSPSGIWHQVSGLWPKKANHDQEKRVTVKHEGKEKSVYIRNQDKYITPGAENSESLRRFFKDKRLADSLSSSLTASVKRSLGKAASSLGKAASSLGKAASIFTLFPDASLEKGKEPVESPTPENVSPKYSVRPTIGPEGDLVQVQCLDVGTWERHRREEQNKRPQQSVQSSQPAGLQPSSALKKQPPAIPPRTPQQAELTPSQPSPVHQYRHVPTVSSHQPPRRPQGSSVRNRIAQLQQPTQKLQQTSNVERYCQTAGIGGFSYFK